MRILIRRNGTEDWQLVESADYNREAELQALLTESPSLIPIDELREEASPFLVAVPEFGLPGSGQTDLLAITAEGDLAVIECKLDANPDIKRKVVGQILEYAAYLWGMTYDELNTRVHERLRKDVADLVSEAVGDSDWDEEEFRNNVSQSLKNGDFMLVIAVDQVNEELNRTIRFLSSCANASFSFHALEMRRFETGDVEILVPHVHGAPVTLPEPGRARRQWTWERFLAASQKQLPGEVVSVIVDIYEWCKDLAHRVWFGTGKKTGSFTFHYDQDGKTVSVFSVYTSGYLVLNYGWLSDAVDRSLVQEFHDSLHDIPGFHDIAADFSRWPSVKIENVFVNQVDALQRFKQAVIEFGGKVRGA